jgi:hypothetical protein
MYNAVQLVVPRQNFRWPKFGTRKCPTWDFPSLSVAREREEVVQLSHFQRTVLTRHVDEKKKLPRLSGDSHERCMCSGFSSDFSEVIDLCSTSCVEIFSIKQSVFIM